MIANAWREQVALHLVPGLRKNVFAFYLPEKYFLSCHQKQYIVLFVSKWIVENK